MAYTELIKNFERIRVYMRDFYVYGFKSREEYSQKSGRSYDNERRRMESYLGEYMGFRQTSSGKQVFLSIDSRHTLHNPLYQALKAKSFTSGDITLHFMLLDILHDAQEAYSLQEILKRIDEDYLPAFDRPFLVDESTLRKKLQEYRTLGLIVAEKEGRQLYYRRAASMDLSAWQDAIAYFSEAGLLGVIGSFLLDKWEHTPDLFAFKHHYITHAMESDIECQLLMAMSERRMVTIQTVSRHERDEKRWEVVPLRLFISVQNGRRYLLGYNQRLHQICSYRLDYIHKVEPGEPVDNFDDLRRQLEDRQPHMWGVNGCKRTDNLERVAFTVWFGENELHILRRLEREKRCGQVERLDEHHARFVADVYDSSEMIPWIRTFIGRITQLNFSNRSVENHFRQDIESMYRMYE